MADEVKDVPVQAADNDINVMMDDTGINIWLDKYNDVFSGFDTRPLDKRRLSNDFITEIGKMVRENPTAQVELNFNVLDDTSDTEVESIIVSHLKTHFANKKKEEKESVKRTFRKGYLLTAAGFTMILVLAYISSISEGMFFINSLPMLTEPLAWFMTWTGLDHIFRHYGNGEVFDLNAKMLEARINFICMGSSSTSTGTETVAQKPRKVIPAGNNLRIA